MPHQILLRQLTRKLRPGTLAGFWQVHFNHPRTLVLTRGIEFDAHLPSHLDVMQGRYTLQPWNEVANSAYSQPPVPQVDTSYLWLLDIRMHDLWGM